MKFTRIVEETVSGTSVEEYRIRMNEKYPTLDIASDEFSIVADGAIDILEQHIHIANYWIGWIKALEKTYSSTDSIPSEAECSLTDTPLAEFSECTEYRHRGIVIADIPIKGTIGTITDVGHAVYLFIPITDNEGVRFRLRKDQISRVGDEDYRRVMFLGEVITKTDDIRKKMDSIGIATTIIHHM